MKTSDPKEQFLTVMKNCKFGVFRAQTDIQKVVEIFGSSETIEKPTDDGLVLYIDGFDMFFNNLNFNSLSGVKAHFGHQDNWSHNCRLSDLTWLEWISGQNRCDIEEILLADNMSFRSLKYTDDSVGILAMKGNSSLLILFNESGDIASIYNWYDRFASYTVLKELRSHNI